MRNNMKQGTPIIHPVHGRGIYLSENKCRFGLDIKEVDVNELQKVDESELIELIHHLISSEFHSADKEISFDKAGMLVQCAYLIGSEKADDLMNDLQPEFFKY